MKRITIGHHEDTYCEHCGWPLDKGDSAIWDDRFEDVTCGGACFARNRRHIETETARHEVMRENAPALLHEDTP